MLNLFTCTFRIREKQAFTTIDKEDIITLSNRGVKVCSMMQAWSFFVQHAGVDQGRVQRILTLLIVFQRVHFISADL